MTTQPVTADPEMPALITEHRDCLASLTGAVAGFGMNVRVTSIPPTWRAAKDEESLTCPHGTTYWLRPQQVAEKATA
jgi:hypothetical protein